MRILSDEPKALVRAAEMLLDSSATIRKNFTIDELAFRLNDEIRTLRETKEDRAFTGCYGWFLIMFRDEDGQEEIRLLLSVADFHRYPDDPATQQFIREDGPVVYDSSCPAEWLEEDGAN